MIFQNLFYCYFKYDKTIQDSTLRCCEVAVPVRDPALRQRLHAMFDVMLQDNIKARDQLPDGTYVRRTVPEEEEALNAQEYFLACAYGQK